MTDEKKDILWRVYLVYFGILAFSLAIVAKMLYIQIAQGAELKEKAQTQEITVKDLEASRGNILADDGSLLATSIPIFEVRFDVASPHISDELFNSKVDSLAQGISNILGKSSKHNIKSKLIRARKKGKRYELLSRNVTYDQLKELRQLPIFRRGKYRGGLITIPKTTRIMPYKELAARTIGYEIKKENLYVGLEGAYSDVLTGKNGKMMMRRINHGDWVPIHNQFEVEPKDGLDIVTTLDVNIQDIAEAALLQQLQKDTADQGCAVVMEVKTGHIKAIANLRYDSTDRKYKESYNFAIAETMEPGSTFKLYSMLVAMEDNKVKLTDSVITGEGYTTYHRRTMRDAHKIGNGRITARDAFEHSSNVGISKIITEAYKDNPTDFIDGIYKLGVNKPLGIELKGEGKPYIKHPSNKKTWYGTSLPWMSIGYELTLTPLQNLTLYNAVANNGKMVKPMFVTEVREAGTTKEKFETQVINEQIVSEETIKKAQSLLRGVVERGTARRAFKGAPYPVAGKTGTTQIVSGGSYQRHKHNALFVGYFPADNPKYSCIVVVNNPRGRSYYGGSVAAPVFRKISDEIFATSLALEREHSTDTASVKFVPVTAPAWYADIKSVYEELRFPQDDYTHNDPWVTSAITDNKIEINAEYFTPDITPDVIGMKAKDAVYLLENLGYRTTINGKGRVRSQSVRAGTPVTKGREINLQLSTY